ncbi:MAG: nucleotidyltransferase domain-containing protein [Deltaproteobacteria bacterium]|nr:nucleotidyltransferase domain-containing protein [Deltaproteobacteria bacterium]
MRPHRPDTQTLYSQLFEAAVSHELELVGGFANGLVIEREVRGRTYLYWQLRDLEGRLRQAYLGPRGSARAEALRGALVAGKARRAPILEDLERLTAAYLASGGARHQANHFKIVDALARAGLFRSGALLVGSHAFVSIGAALGVSWSSETIATADIDLCRDEFVSVACGQLERVDIPGVLAYVDPTFFLIPELDLKTPSTALRSRAGGVKVDLLTTARTPRDTRPKPIPPFGLGGQPLRSMDYLIRADVERGLFIGPHAVVVNVPHAGRYALHKLAVATRRREVIKADKDRRQAAELIRALAELQPGALRHAVDAARAHHDRGFVRDMRGSLERLAPDVRDAVGL